MTISFAISWDYQSKAGYLLAVQAGLALLDWPELNEFKHTTILR